MRKAMQLLGVLSDLDVDWMARVGTVQSLRPDVLLIKERNPIDSLYIVLEGQLSVFIRAAGGAEVARLQSGEIVGEISFVDTRPPLASVMTVEDSLILALDHATLTGKLKEDDGFAARFYRAIASFLAGRLYVTTSRLGYGGTHQDFDLDELPDEEMEEVSMGSLRFDALLRKVRLDHQA